MTVGVVLEAATGFRPQQGGARIGFASDLDSNRMKTALRLLPQQIRDSNKEAEFELLGLAVFAARIRECRDNTGDALQARALYPFEQLSFVA